MRRLTVLPSLLVFALSLNAQNALYTMTSLAGGPVPAQSPAFSIPLRPNLVTYDRNGVLYFVDNLSESVYKVDVQGLLIRVAGTGGGGTANEGGSALAAGLSPTALAFDPSNNLYIGEPGQVRKVNMVTGIITTITGNGSLTFSGDNGPAVNARVSTVDALAFDLLGNLYIADGFNDRVREITAADGIMHTVAGNGSSGNINAANGDGGLATNAELDNPTGVAVDSGNNLFIADYFHARIRRVDFINHVITTVAGSAGTGTGGDGGPATSAQIGGPEAIAIDPAGNLYILDTGNAKVRVVNKSNGLISTFAGTGVAGFNGDGGPASQAQLNFPVSIAMDAAGHLAIADQSNSRVRVVSSGTITTVEAYGSAGDGGTVAHALFYQPRYLASDAKGNLYISDNSRIRRIDVATSIITTVAGTIISGTTGDNGPAKSARINPTSIALDASGNLLIAENDRLRRVDANTGVITTVAGNGTPGFSGDSGPSISATFTGIFGIAVDRSGNVYLSDNGNYRIRRIDGTTGFVTTIAGSGAQFYAGDQGPALSASFNRLGAIALDPAGNLYVVDLFRVRRIDAMTHVITTVAGIGTSGFSGDNGPAVNAQFGFIGGIGFTSGGELLIADNGNSRVRRVSHAGIVTTLAGNGTQIIPPGRIAITFPEVDPVSVAAGNFGNIYVSDSGNNRIRLLTPQVYGVIDTPADYANVSGAIGFTGWALSSAGVTSVGLYRDPLGSEAVDPNTGLVFLGNAPLIPGARPDIAAAFPGVPGDTSGWGAQILTNELPNSDGTIGVGNGTYRIHAIAKDASNVSNDIGVRTIIADNAHSNLPFGTIDTPAPGETITGTYLNFGWAVTPQPNLVPFDGSTCTVFIDGKPLANSSALGDRADIATLFAGYKNAHNAVGHLFIDSTKLSNGLHTIAWSAVDSAGQIQGLGSRFFRVQNP